MKISKLILLVVALFLNLPQLTQADPKETLYQRYLQKSFAQNATIGDVGDDEVSLVAGKFSQRIDHFDPNNKTTFSQGYVLDSTYAKDNKSPVLYYLCGEAACEGPTATTLVNRLAKKLGAHRLALEHRYYGRSQPFSGLEANNLRYLTMEQALEDLATFQKYAMESMNLNGKWIAVGGSYAGSLSAFYRMKYPELVVGALASSAPVFAKANFEEYDHHVAKVAGAECLKNIQTAVAAIETKLANAESAKSMKKIFELETVKDHVDLLYVVADMAAAAIQYGFQDQFCGALKEGATGAKLIESYATIGKKVFSMLGLTPFQDTIQSMENADPEAYVDGVGMRAWMYQSCTQFGFYQTAYHEPKESSRSARITLDYHHKACDRLFGLKKQVDADKTNADFYKKLFDKKVKNIYFTNGSNDPWSNLSLSESAAQDNPALKLFTIMGSAHCDDLGSRASDALTQARTLFEGYVAEWLKD